MILKTRLLLVGFIILLLLGCCSSTNNSQTPSPSTSTPALNLPQATKTPLHLAETPVLSTSTPTSTPLPPTDIPALNTPIPTPTTPSPTKQLTDGITEIISYVEELAAQDQFSGAILIATDSNVVWEFANGLADREANIANQVDTKFNLGSMSKMFTAVAIIQLMEQNQLNLDDTIAEHIPDYPNTQVANQVTIHQLLTHTSGLGDTFTEEFEVDPNQYRSNEDFLPLFVNEPLLFSPGAEFAYSNAGYVVLGLIIEAISGQSYYEYVHQRIFEPSGMVNTDSFNIEDDIPNLAIGYTTQDIHSNETGVLARNSALMPGKGFAAGGGYSTVEDLLMFRNALLGNELLSPSSTDLLITGKVGIRENTQYAYGFFDRLEIGHRMVGHTGGAPGVCSFLSMYPDTGNTVAVLSNSDSDCMAVLMFLGTNSWQ